MTTVSSTTSLLSTSYSSSSTTSTTSTSDIDWDSLIEGAVAAKLAKADTIEVKITDNEAVIAAYESLQELLQTVLSAANSLRAPSGTLDSDDDVFSTRTAYYSANGDVDAADTAGATIENGAETGSYELTVTQLAAAHKVIGTSQDGSSEDLGYDGVFTLGVVDGDAVEIAVSEDMSLADIAEAINNASDESGVQASVLQVASGDFRLILSTVDTGETITTASSSGDDILSELGITNSSGAFVSELQAARDAIFSIDGVEITRSSNEIDDVLDGVTLYLYQTTPDDTSITIEIEPDVSAVKQAITELAEAYNAFREFAYTQQQVSTTNDDDETEVVVGVVVNAEQTESVLFGDGTMRSISSAVTNALNTLVDGESMALLGLSFDETNLLVLDEDKLDDALLTSLDEIEALLTFSMTSSSSHLLLLERGTGVPDAFTLDITVDDNGEITSASVLGDSSLFTVSGTRIVGVEGTEYEGFTFVYAGSSSVAVDLSFSSGIAERLYNVADSSDGTLASLMTDLEETNETLAAQSEDITERAETYRSNLTSRYAAYQAAIESAESMLDYLTTLIDTWNISS